MKRSLLLAALAAAFLATPSAARQAILWVPQGDSGIEEILSLLEADAALRLTAAYSSPPKDVAGRIKKLEAEGRLELALRPYGDPPLPLLYYPAADEVKWEGKPSTGTFRADQYFLSLRLSLAREAAAKELQKIPAGLVSPPGGLAADYFPLARAFGLKWIACGPLASTAAAVLESGGVHAVPFTPFSSWAARDGDPLFTLFDETSSGDPAATRALLAAELTARTTRELLTVSQALEAAVSTSAAPSEISAAAPPWVGDYSRWASAPLQAGALAALAQTRSDLMLHLNSVQGDYRKASQAFNEYFSAEQGARLLALASPEAEISEQAEGELRNYLANSYRLMKRPPPPWAFSGLGDAYGGQGQSGKLTAENIPGGFRINNSARPALPPASTPGLPAAAAPGSIWKLEALKVTVGEDGTLFQFRPAALDNSLKTAAGFSHIKLDLYMDINHRPRAGIGRPLQGRPFRFFPECAWEYALEISPEGASLYKITPKGAKAAGTFQPETKDGWIKVLVPPGLLRGTPGLWGYAALVLAPEKGGYAVTDYLAEDINNGYIYSFRPAAK